LTGSEVADELAEGGVKAPESRRIRVVVEWLLIFPPAIWVFGNLVATLLVSMSRGRWWVDPVVEVPYAELGVQNL